MVRLIHFTHWAVLVFVLSAWAWPWPAAQWVHIVFVPIMILHWKTNQNRCILSQLEERYKSPTASEVAEVEENHFIKLVWKAIFGTLPSEAALERVIYAIMGTAWLISLTRILLRR